MRKNLVDKRLPIIYDEKHFSQLVGIDLDYLLSAANSPKHFYRYFTIPKKKWKDSKNFRTASCSKRSTIL